MSTSLAARIDPFEVAVFVLFSLALVGGLYNLIDAWRNMLAVLRANNGQTSGRLVAVGLDDLWRAFIKVSLLALPGVLVGILLMLFAPGDAISEPVRYAIGLFLRVSYLAFATGLLFVIASSVWLRRFLAQPELVSLGDRADRLEAALQENTELTKEVATNTVLAVEKADAAYREANSVNSKIASLGEGLTAQQAQERLTHELPPHEAPA